MFKPLFKIKLLNDIRFLGRAGEVINVIDARPYMSEGDVNEYGNRDDTRVALRANPSSWGSGNWFDRLYKEDYIILPKVNTKPDWL